MVCGPAVRVRARRTTSVYGWQEPSQCSFKVGRLWCQDESAEIQPEPIPHTGSPKTLGKGLSSGDKPLRRKGLCDLWLRGSECAARFRGRSHYGGADLWRAHNTSSTHRTHLQQASLDGKAFYTRGSYLPESNGKPLYRLPSEDGARGPAEPRVSAAPAPPWASASSRARTEARMVRTAFRKKAGSTASNSSDGRW